eukprot:s264_g23.t1
MSCSLKNNTGCQQPFGMKNLHICNLGMQLMDFLLGLQPSPANANFFSDSANFSLTSANFFSDSSLSSKNPAIAAFRMSVSLIWFRISIRFAVFLRAEVATCVDTTRRSVLHKMRWQRAQDSARKWLLIDEGLTKRLQQFP